MYINIYISIFKYVCVWRRILSGEIGLPCRKGNIFSYIHAYMYIDR